jgi:IclR family KDG regulon transcriptional repressor
MKPATSIEKVCRVLDAFRTRPSIGVTELAAGAGLLASDAHRILKSLQVFGYVEQDAETRKYRLGLELLKLGHLVHQRLELREVARPFLRKLSQAVEATANLAVVDPREPEVIFVEQIDFPSEVQIKLRIGSRASPHATSVGKVLTAFAPPALGQQLLHKEGWKRKTARTIVDPARFRREAELVRRQGYAVDREEAMDGACCVGAPVRDHTGAVVAAVSVSMMAARLGKWQEGSVAAAVRAAARKISTALGHADRGVRGKAGCAR